MRTRCSTAYSWGMVSPLSSTQMSHWASARKRLMAAVLPSRCSCSMSLMRASFGHVLLDDGHRVVGAGAGHDDDLDDLDFVQMLIQQRLHQRADILFLVVRGHTDAARNHMVTRLGHSKRFPPIGDREIGIGDWGLGCRPRLCLSPNPFSPITDSRIPTPDHFCSINFATVTPSPPSPGPPARNSPTKGWLFRLSRMASRSAPVPLPWMMRTQGKRAM